MKIAIDVSIQETPYITGVERVQRALLRALAAIDCDNEYLLVSQKPVDVGIELPQNFRSFAVCPDGSPYLWRERFVPSLLAREKVDVFHSPVSATPILGKAKKIATVHELPWVERDAGAGADHIAKRGHRVWLFLNVRYASRIIAVSQRTRDNIVALYPEAAARVGVIHHGVDAQFRPLAELPPRAAFLGRFGVPDQPFLLFVGTLRRKKNLRGLLKAFASLPEQERKRYRLVLAGVRTPAWPEFDELVKKLKIADRVHTPGYVSDADLVVLYNFASALVYPSLFEGFGLPPLEAMSCGTPVITSTGGAIPEVVGEAARTVAPDDPAALRDAILAVVRGKAVAEDLRQRGFAHARRFTWERAARQYLALYRELAGAAPELASGAAPA